ncbi:helix-turn-helix domain-containing protein [Saccharopolyspora phatthalungensis]|uniref:Transcriptional regulator with XRE-family HTH domain n=1 Tax=Saccharopolyspora phatthalungensis TaxID=664693 RepID=A0A840Q6M1_9PSEU|nr:helix-turn-helix transcriptional regulator [Saccharopolyspora phatthalungensis]MBB5156116.1 transcriptional regulator with XRE-family HTH domain [Saccharopolyspora phatthalungensis]
MSGQSLGDRIRQLRGDLYTQRALADRAQISVEVVRNLEQGKRNTASVATLHKLARALDVTLAELLVPATIPEHDQDESVTALRHAVSLATTPKDKPLTIEEAKHAEIAAWRNYWDAKHDVIARTFPSVIRRLEAAHAVANERDRSSYAQSLAQVLWAASRSLTLLRYPEAAQLAIRRAIQVGSNIDDPYFVAGARRSLAWQLLVEGRYQESIDLSTSVAREIEPGASADAAQLSVYGSSLLQAGNAAARAGNAAQAHYFLSEANEISRHVQDGRCDYGTPFGPSFTAMQSTDIEINLGNFGKASEAASAMPNRGTALRLQSQCRHGIDRALISLKTGKPGEAVAVLSSVKSVAPFWFKHQRLPRSIVRDLLHTSAAKDDRLRSMATCLGVR